MEEQRSVRKEGFIIEEVEDGVYIEEPETGFEYLAEGYSLDQIGEEMAWAEFVRRVGREFVEKYKEFEGEV